MPVKSFRFTSIADLAHDINKYGKGTYNVPDELEEEMKKQPEDRNPHTFELLLNSGIAYGVGRIAEDIPYFNHQCKTCKSTWKCADENCDEGKITTCRQCLKVKQKAIGNIMARLYFGVK